MSIGADFTALHGIASALRAAGEDLDGACRSIPASTGTGDAAPLLAGILTTVSGTVAYLAYEADLLGERVAECEQTLAATDSGADERLAAIVGELG
ncbi:MULTISPECIES: hypothetical protein [Cellulomonas]|uniref:hypothetical protein n=1 Tax=Cellulomonas TaxID=1707 RepID=UPI0010A937DF|nr:MULTISPECIES: hypothetical protein [Cellulomonas]QGQ20229.1 hypothetical protein GC089_14760 [Cellulomonas sp. JZ18]